MKKLMKLAVFAGIVAIVAKVATAQKAEWQGLTESEVREKLDTKLPDRVPGDKRAAVADQIVTAMREKGALRTEAEDAGVAGEGDSGDAAEVADAADAPGPAEGTADNGEDSDQT